MSAKKESPYFIKLDKIVTMLGKWEQDKSIKLPPCQTMQDVMDRYRAWFMLQYNKGVHAGDPHPDIYGLQIDKKGAITYDDLMKAVFLQSTLIKNKIIKLFKKYENETEWDGVTINENNYNKLADELVRLFAKNIAKK